MPAATPRLPRHPSSSVIVSVVVPNLLFQRNFSSSVPKGARSSVSQLNHLHSTIPPYPYPASRTYKQSNFGLYGGSHIQFGNKISSKNEIKTRRRWYPNIHSKKLWSESLGKFVQVKVQARVLRTIDKVGGLDEYLLGGKKARLKELGMGGWALRWRIWQTDMVTERFRKERESLGVPDHGWEGLIRKMKREGKEKEEERKVVEDSKLVAIVGRRKEDLVEEDHNLKEQEEAQEQEEVPSRDKPFMEENPPLVKSLR